MGSLVGQLMFDGLAMGLVFVILATGMVIITSVNKILFFAYGNFYTIGAYAVWYAVQQVGLPYYVALPVGVLAAAILGMLSYILIFQYIQDKEGGFLASLIAAMGLAMILSQGGLLVFGTMPRSIPTVFPGVLSVFGITMGIDKLALMGMGVFVTLFLFWVYEKTTIGRIMRAVSFLPEAASLQGINTNRIHLLALGLGCALAGFAGGILAPSYGMNVQMGNTVLWTVMLMIMLGGMDSLPGAVFSGIVIGQVLSFGQFFIGSIVQLILFILIGIILYFKPNGLMGRGIDVGV